MKTQSTPTRSPGRPRSEATTEAILKAALQLLHEMGFGNLTIEGVAARAGVSKATIYRWWPNKASIVMDAFLVYSSAQIAFADSGSVREDIRCQMQALASLFLSPQGRVIAALLGSAQADKDLAEAFRSRWLIPRRKDAKRVVQLGIERGQLRGDLDPEVAIDALYGPLYYRLLTGYAPLTSEFIDALARHVMDGLATD